MVAFDHLRLKLKDFDWAYQFQHIYKELIQNEEKNEETKKKKK